ncbi:cadherin-like beta sandwich domain-containing protein [Paenibacillus sp. WQ 127069]|uniref:Cadherin-like beta sandwich domain-containing protein n=1 Tax=Paenibacillus baimaensis TaxID=2982185 RepID=A0ABT2UCJ3_9BACL|nr:cadherin-like beta sandwich domain-containing protein [Paenibacillus sp. WQ 127069]MCU6792350.1 cadherin-like beta sandwich domain-containing protein [Paenibacillus sp. WQ 127069]
MGIIRSSPGIRQTVRSSLAVVLLIAVILTVLSIYSQAVFAASSWRMGAAGPDDPAALGFEPFGIDVDPVNGYLFVTDASSGTVKIFKLDGAPTVMSLTASSGSFSDPLAVKFDGKDHVYVTDKLYLYRFDVTFLSGAYTFTNMIKWDGNSAAPSIGRLNYPQGIAVYDDNLYVSDTEANRVLKFDASTFSPMSSPVVWSGDLDPDPDVDATLNGPYGIAADSSGVYIGNRVNTNAKIIKLKTDGGTLVKTINKPYGFTLHSDGNLYVAVNGSSGSLVTRFDSSLNTGSVFFTGNNNFIVPTHIAFDQTGAMYLATYAQAAGYDIIYDTVWKQSLGSPDNRLSGLTASGITLSPSPFSSNTQDYTASVGSSVTSTTITPVLSDSTASVTVKGLSVTNGNASSPITLSKGDNTIPVVVTAINGAARTYTITVTRAPYTDATLSGLTVSPGSLNETFAAGTLAYTANVANSVTSIDVTPTVNNSRATVKVNNATATSGSASTVSSLAVGPNPITVSVTAEDGTTSNDYTITVMRAPSSVATLGSLTVSPGALNETFASGTLSYTTNVANSVGSISVTPTVSDSMANLTVNGTSSVSGSVYGPISLVVGANTITVVVTAQDGVTTKPYTIVVTRAPSSTAMLSALTISPGSFNETFASGTTSYTASVANNVAAINVTPTISDSTASLKVNGTVSVSGSVYGPVPLAVGANTITVAVTAQDGITTTPYSIVVTRAPSSVATLGSLTVSTGSLNETFASAATSYTASVANGVAAVSVTPTVSDSTATLTVNGHSSVSGAVYGPIPLSIGANTVTVVVTAQDGTTTPYSIVVMRAPSSAAMLSALKISPGTLNEPFASETLAYTASVEHNVSSINVTPMVIDESHATLTINGVPAANGSDFGPIALNTGSNIVTVVVTAQDGVTQRSYRLDIFRTALNKSSGPAVNAADLISLSLLADEKTLTLSPAFKGDTLSYTAETTAKKVQLTAKTLYKDASVSLLGNKLQEEVALELLPGDNTIELQVTHPSGPLRTYTITIHRPTAGPLPVQPSGDSGTVMPTIALNDIAGNWAEAEIRKAVAEGWVAGYPDGSFHPERDVTRAEFVQLLARSLGWKEPEVWNMPVYADIDDIGLWAQPAISMAVQQGIINGYEDGSFRPARPLTRAEMTMMIIRTFGVPVEMDQSTSFADNSSIPPWSLPYIAEAAKRGLVNGLENNRFEPNGTATRAEAVVILTRLLNRK